MPGQEWNARLAQVAAEGGFAMTFAHRQLMHGDPSKFTSGQATTAAEIRRPVTRADFGPSGEVGDKYFREFLARDQMQFPCGWDERDYKGV
ncbi:hypothetical protein GCM10025759_19180 [Lysobacter panacisoli]|uniref:Uncharacterized protein n=1 Tax=Lysobacter panacisoli TaxID=1255263 RepID=A0ABP9LEY2_9GAMM